MNQGDVVRAMPAVDPYDITASIAALDDQERWQIALAGTAIEMAILIDRGRPRDAAILLARVQQAPARAVGPGGVRSRSETIRELLDALGYGQARPEVAYEPGSPART